MNSLRLMLIVAALILGLGWQAQAQTYATTTTLAAAVDGRVGDNPQTFITVASATGFTVDNYVYVDREVMRITAVTGTTISVIRGQLGTPTQAHANAEQVHTGERRFFQTTDPSYGQACTVGAGEAVFIPRINVLNGLIWTCVSSLWRATSTAAITYGSTPTSWP